MTYDLARPRYTLPLAGKTYELLGTFELIEAVEYALKQGIVVVAVEVVRDMTSTNLAKLLSAILTASDQQMDATAAGDLLWSKVGLVGEGNALLRLHLYAFLSICLSAPPDREAKATEMGELIGNLTTDSLGETISEPALAS